MDIQIQSVLDFVSPYKDEVMLSSGEKALFSQLAELENQNKHQV